MPDLKLPSGPWFDWLVEIPGKIVLVFLIAFVVRWLLNRIIGKVVHRASAGPVPSVLNGTKAGEVLANLNPGADQRRESRAKTTGSLLRSINTAVTMGIAFVTVLSIVGVPIAPLLTSAGIAGVALGFGAQTLVKDLLAGIFMMLEDQYGVGDAVDLGSASGTVEAVGLRVTRLRDADGTVWYVRNGEVLRVGNQSQSWSRMILDVTVAHDSDIERAQQVLTEEAHAVCTDEKFAEMVIGEPHVWGVERIDKDGVVIRVVIKTAPAQQGPVGRALRRRVMRRFDAEGISMSTMGWPL